VAKLFYGIFEKTLFGYYECYGGMTAALFSEILLSAGLDDSGLELLTNTDETVFSKFRSGKLNIYDNILSHYYKEDTLDKVASYFSRNITKHIDKNRARDLLRDLTDLIFSDVDIAYGQKKIFEQLAVPDTLNDFLSEVFIYAIKQKSRPQRKERFPFNNLPFDKNDFFTGRDDEIKAINDNFRNAVRMQTISGMSGSGKTQIALEYAHYHAKMYDVVWWIDAETPTSIHASVKRFLELKKCLPETESAEAEREAFLRWFDSSNENWLLIYDNAVYFTDSEYETLQKYMPKNSGVGNILLITVCGKKYLDELFIEIDVFSENIAQEFLQRRTKNYDADGAADLAGRLGCLPLALEQAGAYIAERLNGSYDAYQKRLREHGVDLFNKTGKAKNHNYTVTKTLQIALDAIEIPSAAEFLNICAYLSPDGIDTFFLYTYACTGKDNLLSKEMFGDINDDLELLNLIGELSRYSLCKCEYIVRDQHGMRNWYEHFGGIKKLHVHRLVQEVIREKLGIDLTFLYLCIDMLDVALRSTDGFDIDFGADFRFDFGIFDYSDDKTLNILTVLEHIDRTKPAIEDKAILSKLVTLSLYISLSMKRRDESKGFWVGKMLIDFTGRAYGHNHAHTANVLWRNGKLFHQTHYKECMQYFSQGLAIYHQNIDKPDEEIGKKYAKVIHICLEHGDYNGAVEYYEKMKSECLRNPANFGLHEDDIADITAMIEDVKKKNSQENPADL
jgi:pentatricopeptide repeat protein